MNPPLVSIIVTSHNRARILPQTLASVFAQTYPHIEVILIDDGSTDDTASVAAGYGERVRYHWQANQGVSLARNRGLRLAHGELINFLDDDDLLAAQKIERQIRVLETQPNAGLVHCGYHYIDRDGNLIETTGRLPEGDVREELAWGCFPWVGGPLIRREILSAEISLDEHRDWFSDWGMWQRIALAGYEFACVQEPLGSYRIAPGSMTEAKVADAERAVFNILDGVFADPRLPGPILAQKNQIVAAWGVWIACRYVSGGFFDEFQRCINKTLALWPELLVEHEPLLEILYWDAINPRTQIHGSLQAVNNIFDHLPASAAPLARQRQKLLGQVSAALALRAFGRGNVLDAHALLSDAVRFHPAMLRQPTAFITAAREYAETLPARGAFDFVDFIFANLPPEAAPLRRARSNILGEMHLARAFNRYFSSQRREIPGRVLTAFWNNPSLAKNRGAWAILFKSLPSFFRPKE